MTKIQALSNIMKFLEVHQHRACFNIKDKLLNLTPSTIKKETQCLVGLFGFWRQHNPHLGVTSVHLLSDPECIQFRVGPRTRMALRRSRILCTPATGTHGLANPVLLKISMRGREVSLFGAFGRVLCESAQTLRILKQNSTILCRLLLSI